MATATARGVRSDGARSRRGILATAARLATVRGLESLSIGELAAEVGISKSGLFAHFGSKEELQLATVATAGSLFEEEVLAPARLVPPGVAGLVALADAFLAHLRNEVFPGGCFFQAASAELHARPGRVRDAIAAFQEAWQDLLMTHLVAARDAGDLPADAELEQIRFEVNAYLVLAHSEFTFTGEDAVLDRAARAVRRRLGVG